MKIKVMDENSSWRLATESEIKTIKMIVGAGAYAHSYNNCFCDKYNNLYSLTYENSLCKETNQSYLYVSILFLKSNVKNIENSRKSGYYEANYYVFETIDSLFARIPKVS